ncbi:MAG: ABC transporter substrate-binding protein [bacterium]|nr:ABC transporter substrate-binding protein [bacterium]MXV90551.1 ABC transporter substrate-binding protein [Acidimicrobiia bacterium]MYC44122.1 ABC transporter substrate-binding protein [Acidimicrobiia bacterium]MYI19534.1 ABC transporter substrate-binding protein [Acidimicrobiia bacterium]
MRDLVRTRRRWLVALLGLMLVAASCAADDGASDTAASAMAEAQAAESDAGVALADAQAAAAKAREAQAAADTAAAAAALAQATAEGNQAAVAQAEADLAAAQAAAESARADAAAAQAEADDAAAAAAAAVEAAEAQTAAPAPPPAEDTERVLVVGVPGDIETLDTCCANFIRAHEALELVYEPPVLHRTVEQNGALIGAAGDLMPRYFESWEAHEDGLTYTIKVRPGVLFDDGTEVTAETVRFMTERNLNTPGGANWLLRNIAFIQEPPEVLDKYTLRFTSSEASPMVMEHFYMTSSAIIDPKVILENATEDDPWAMEYFSRNVDNASGPFRLVSRIPDQEVVFEARENYSFEPQAYDRIIWKIIPSNAERVQLLKAGVIDVAIALGTEDFAALEGAEGVNVQRFPSKNLAYMGMGNRIAPFDDKTVRQAVSYAVDYDDILNNVYKGEAQRLYGPIAPGSYSSLGDSIGYRRDVAKAQELLDGSSYDGSPVVLSIDAAKGEHELIAVRIQSHLADIGMDVEIEKLASPVYAERKVGENRMQMFIDEGLPWIDDPNYTLSVFLLSGVFGNYTQYVNERVDQIINEGWGILDREERARTFEEAQRIIVDDAPWVFLALPDYKIAMRDTVEGFVLYPNAIPRLAGLRPAE